MGGGGLERLRIGGENKYFISSDLLRYRLEIP